MLDPRIYRTGLVAVALAVIVFAFSLESQPSGLGTTLAPDAFNPQNAQTTLSSLARTFPDRRPGGSADGQIADYVGGSLGKLGYSVARTSFSAPTPGGRRTLVNVTATLAGQTNDTILIVSHRDAEQTPGLADLSGTAVMLELGRVLAGETADHTIVLASVSGSVGAVGARRLAHDLPGPVDAVIVLGDLVSGHPEGSVVVPWSSGHTLASPALRNTLAGAVAAQAQIKAAPPGPGGQLMHLAFPMTVGEQAPFNVAGAPAVLLTLAGEHAAAAQPVNPAQMGPLGRAVLQSVNALNAGADVARPSAYLVISGKLIPAWAVRLLVLILIAPVVITTVDGLARARRRGHRVLDWMVWVLACALAFVLGWGVVKAAHLVGALASAPGGPVPGGVAPPHTAGIVTLAVALLVIVLGLAVLAPRLARLAGLHLRAPLEPGAGPAGGIGVSLLLSVAGVAIWATNPFAAVLLVPALHVWMWLGCVEAPIPRVVKLLGVLVGALGPALAVLYYALALHLSPIGVLWNGVLLIATGQIGSASAVLWSLTLGCFAGMLVLALRPSGRAREEQAPITVRGPATYAGPGSLGGTRSALRR